MDYFTENDSILSVKRDVSLLFTLEAQASSSATTTQLHASNTMHTLIESGNSSPIAVNDAQTSQADIASFLNRKVQIATKQWSVGGDFVQILKPWNLFLSNAAVSNKLQNFQLIKGDLMITIFINGTPFHEGMALASYNYLGAGSTLITIGGDTQLVTRSQRPHIYLNASTGKGGCICVPFFVPSNYLSLTDPLFDAASIGTLNIDSFGTLAQLSAGTDVVTITVFAEMKNVVLTGPTMVAVSLSGLSTLKFDMFELEAQAGDEYDNSGVISGPASAIASIAGRLADVPVIGPFALATQIGAAAVSSIARLFGYSKPIQIADVVPMRNFPVSSLALTEGADTSQKLTVTGKAELSIDPRIVEMEPEDLLSIASLTKRESYITQFSWGVADVVGDTIFAMDVDPMAERRAAVLGGYSIQPTSLSFAGRPFSAWSGTLKYRFQIVGTQYHRGRISIIYDPTGPLSGDPYNTTFNTIADLSEARDFTVEFKWQQDRGYSFITTDNARTFYTETTPAARTSTRKTCNGIFYVRVVNELVTPDSVTGVKVLVSISAGDDFEYVNPKGSTLNVFPFAPVVQSGESRVEFSMFDLEPQSAVEETPITENAPEQAGEILTLTSGVEVHPEEKPLIFYGERITSFRQLLKRYCFFRTTSVPSTTAGQLTATYIWKAMPAQGGFNTAGPDTTLGLDPYLYAQNNYINYLKGAFAGWRGSIRWKFLPKRGMENIVISRNTGDGQRELATNYNYYLSSIMNPAYSAGKIAYDEILHLPNTGGGAALTQCRTQDAIEVEVPYTTNLRFSKTKGEFMTVNANSIAAGYPGGDSFNITTSSSTATYFTAFSSYVAAGEDFTLFGWVGAPTVYSAVVPPA